MQSLLFLPLSCRWSGRLRAGIFAMLGFWLVSSQVAIAAAADTHRFQLAGSGTLKLDPPVLENGNVQLRSYLVPVDVAQTTSTIVQAGGPFALSANLEAASLICYNDTIFRNDFDGDGF